METLQSTSDNLNSLLSKLQAQENELESEVGKINQQLAIVREDRKALERTINLLSRGQASAIPSVAQAQSSPYASSHSLEDFLNRYVELHGAPITVGDVAEETVKYGKYDSPERARNSLHPTVRYLIQKGKWTKVRKGLYQPAGVGNGA